MLDDRVHGQSLVTRRALVDIIRPAVVGSYGVTGFVARSLGQRMLGWLGLAERGIRVSLRDGLTIDLYLTVAYGLPVAEVARQADSAVRYALRRALDREVDRLTIHVGGMSYQPASAIVVPAGQEEPAGADAPPDSDVGEAVIAGAGHADDRA
jgi:uncharacterized alkaline shock family protein YloU